MVRYPEHTWAAYFRVEKSLCLIELRNVRILRSQLSGDPQPYCWCTVDGVGVWPGTNPDEWIEYVPECPARTGAGDDCGDCDFCR